MKKYNPQDIIQENNKRKSFYFRDYCPIVGDKESEVISRIKFELDSDVSYIPYTMKSIPLISTLLKSKSIKKLLTSQKYAHTKERERAIKNKIYKYRLEHDCEFWISTCAIIQDKKTKKDIYPKLNRGQRRTLAKLEIMRLAGRPIRIIILKARQWGGSTLVQLYMLWLQIFHYPNWHSAIISQLQSQSANIRSMMAKVCKNHPKSVTTLTLKPFEGMQNIKYIQERGCKIALGTAENPDALRSFDFSMVHMSEVASWADTENKSGDDLAQTIYATVPDVPGSFIAMESTAKGVGGFFHEEYLNAVALRDSDSDDKPEDIFVAWFEIELYTRPIKTDIEKYIESTLKDEYCRYLWNHGATLEGINWYVNYKRNKRYSDFQMKSEYPTTPEEAFQSSSGKYFTEDHIQQLRDTCEPPLFTGDIKGDALTGANSTRGLRLVPDSYNDKNVLKIWTHPESPFPNKRITERFLVVVDIGGKHEKSDNSVISVYDRIGLMSPFGAIEKAAEWVGHIDHDLLAWKAVQIATYYDNALLAIETNTIDSRDKKTKADHVNGGDHSYTVLNEIEDVYDNQYYRGSPPDKAIPNSKPQKVGWHMNKKTKYQAYDTYTMCVREEYYVERSHDAANEAVTLEIKANGELGAISGKKDDRQDTNAVGCEIGYNEMGIPKIIDIVDRSSRHSVITKGSLGAASM